MWKLSGTAALLPQEGSTGAKRGTVTKVLIAEPRQLTRDGMKLLFEDENGMMTSSVASIEELFEKLKRGVPADVAILCMEGASEKDIQLLRDIRKQFPLVKLLVFAAPCKPAFAAQVIEAGANGFVSHYAGTEELLFATRQVDAGKQYVCSHVALSLLGSNSVAGSAEAMISQLSISKREMEILKLIAEGLTNSEIGEKLFTSRRTVETHRKSLIQKTGSKNTAALIRFAVTRGII